MRAVILVGGFGTRLRPLTYTTPKQMLPVVGLPMIERKIAHLVSHGIDDIVLSMGYRPDAFKVAYPDNRCAGAKLTYVVEQQPLNTAGAIAFAAREAGITETFLAFNGDTLTDLDISAIVELHRSRNAEGTIALTPVDDPSRFGVVPTDSDDRVDAFIEKPAVGEAPTNLINAGTYVFEPEVLQRIPYGQPISIERDVFPKMVADRTLYAGSFGRYWIDIGTPASYLQANVDVLQGLDVAGSTAADASVRGAVGEHSYVGPGARVEPGAEVTGSVVGAEAVVAAGARVRNSVLLDGAVVHSGAVIDGSIIGEGATIGDRTEISDLSVIGGRIAVGGGAKLSAAKVGPEAIADRRR